MKQITESAPKNELAQVERRLTRAEFQGLAEMPAEVEWFQNLDSLNTSASYQVDLRNFMKFLGIEKAEEFREVTRSLGETIFREKTWHRLPFAGSFRRCPRSLNISAIRTWSLTIPWPE